MLITSCCLKVQNGIIALVNEKEEIKNLYSDNMEVKKGIMELIS